MYGITLLLALIMVSVTWRYAVRERLVRPDLADEDVQTLTKRLTPTLGVYVAMIVVGLFVPIVAVVGYLALALFILLPFRPSDTGRVRPDGPLWVAFFRSAARRFRVGLASRASGPLRAPARSGPPRSDGMLGVALARSHSHRQVR